MGTLIKFWIAATLVLLLLALFPALQMKNTASSSTSESGMAQEAHLVDFFCLSNTPTSGKVSIPKAWEEVLGVDIRVRESAGEAASDIGLPRERSAEISQLDSGEGLYYLDQRGQHYVMKSNQGQNWLLVLTKSNAAHPEIGPKSAKGPSAIALAIGFAVVGGALMTLLARVAFGPAIRKT